MKKGRNRLDDVNAFMLTVTLAVMLLPVFCKAEESKYNQWLEYKNSLQADKSLVVYYTFEEGKGNLLKNKAIGDPTDEKYIAKEVNATIKGAAWIKDGGRWTGKPALKFDGTDDYVVCLLSNMKLNITDAVTIEMWMKTDTVAPAGYHAIVSLPYNSSDGNNGLDICLNIDAIHSYLRTEDDMSGVYSKSDYADNNWHHLALTYDGSEHVLYLDGKVINSQGRSGDILIQDPQEINIGRFGTCEALPHFTGTIDEVAIYKRGLTLKEIRTHHESGKP